MGKENKWRWTGWKQPYPIFFLFDSRDIYAETITDSKIFKHHRSNYKPLWLSHNLYGSNAVNGRMQKTGKYFCLHPFKTKNPDVKSSSTIHFHWTEVSAPVWNCHCMALWYDTCGRIVILDLTSWSPILAISIPSMTIEPPDASMIRKSANVNELFPAPVLPTIPIWKRQ